jgi:two-component system, NarL family, nitrate/nitrite response regulator NarL
MIASQPSLSLAVSHRPLPSTPRALGTELAGLLRSLGVHAAVTDANGTLLAATPEGAKALAWQGQSPSVGVEVRLCGQSFRVVVAKGGQVDAPLDLTPRQRVVVELIAQGLRNREIAQRLGISLHTVRRHVEALLKRLGVPTRAAAAVLLREALRHEASSEPHRAA